MTDYAALVTALYEHYGRWQSVADVCNDGDGIVRCYSRRYYWRVANGTLPASPAAQECILRATSKVTAVTSTETRDTRKTVHLYIDDLEAGNCERNRLGITWPEMQHLWRMAYFATLEEEATNG